MAVSIQMRYNITSRGVGARQCRAPTGVPYVNENRYSINILNISKQTTGGHPGSNATGLTTSTLLGETLVEQVIRVNVE